MAVEHLNQALLASNIPKSSKKASKKGNSVFREPAIPSRLEAHPKSRKWTVVPTSEAAIILTCKRVFRIKDIPSSSREAIGNPKARLIVRGFQQIHEKDYNETYAPVAKFSSIPCRLGIITHHILELHQNGCHHSNPTGRSRRNYIHGDSRQGSCC